MRAVFRALDQANVERVDRVSIARELRHAEFFDESARQNCATLIDLLESSEAPFDPQNVTPGHIVASAFVTHDNRQAFVLVHHRDLNRWLQPGGHAAAGDDDLRTVAARELQEETNLIVPPAAGHVCDVDVHTIPEGRDHSHLHFDVRFHWRAAGTLSAATDAISASWYTPGEAVALELDSSIWRMIHWATREGYLTRRPSEQG